MELTALAPLSPATNAGIHRRSRQERERHVRRRAMLDAAQAVFAEKGFDRATIEEIAIRAEFGKGTVYNYFQGGKQELLRTLFEELSRDLCALTDSLAEDVRAGCSLRRALETYYTAVIIYFTTRPEQFALVVRNGHQEARGRWGAGSTLHAELQEALIERLSPVLEGADDHTMPVPARMAAGFVLGSLFTYLFIEGFSRQPEPVARPSTPTVEKAAGLLTVMLLDGLVRPHAQQA